MEKSIQEKFNFLEKCLRDKFKDSILKVSKYCVSNHFELKDNVREIAVENWTDGEEFMNMISKIKNIYPNSEIRITHGVFDKYNERVRGYDKVYCLIIEVELCE